ncbi:helix-turn-helix domain-containing protein [Spirulina subsalsa]|uniref:helix-turn-helix domain-containing protein n=1 Tax=Spirulina subsalsa TaxID=54311 RepID=UPI000309CDC0|nr:helix-turn-helix transcriptional regulator [Spirulina subsalsa]
MNNHQHATKRHPCPHCGHDSGCKTFFDGAEQIQKVWCLRVLGDYEVASGWKRVGWLQQDMGAVLIPEEHYTTRKRVQTFSVPSHLPILSTEQRDQEYRHIIRQLDFSFKHHQNLQRRGLSDTEINVAFRENWITSWEQGKSVVASPALAGVNPKTHCLTGTRGLAIAAMNPQNEITGFQLAPDQRTKAKYLWLSSKSQGGNSPHLPTGKLPLFYWQCPQDLRETQDYALPPYDKVQIIYLIEGALKSLIAAFMIWRTNPNAIIIGTATAARFDRHTLKAYLGLHEHPLHSPIQIRLLPDAGSLPNRHIYQANCQTLKHIMSWNLDIKVGNWGQWFDKSEPDFDELLLKSPSVLNPWESDLEEQIYWADPQDYIKRKSRLVTPQAWLNRLKNVPLVDWMKTQLASIGLVESQPKQPTLEYRPGMVFPPPTPGQRSPKIIFKPGQRLQVFQTLQAQGWQFIHDCSAPGLGKSHTFGLLESSGPIVYINIHHRNPSTLPIEQNFTDLPARHEGLAIIPDHYTPSGQPQLCRAKGKEGEIIGERSNCYYSSWFTLLHQKSYSDVGREICGRCDYSGSCWAGKGQYNYLGQLSEVLQSSRIRCHLDSLPDTKLFNYSQAIGIVEEAALCLQATRKQKVKLEDLNTLWNELEQQLPQIYSQLQPLKTSLWQILMGWVRSQSRWGFNDQELRDILPTPPENIAEICQTLQRFNFPWQKVIQEPDSVPILPDYPGGTSLANDIFRHEAKEKTVHKLGKLPPDILLDLVRIWGHLQPGSLRVRGEKLILTTLEERHPDVLKNFKTLVLLDATAGQEDLARKLQVEASQIIQIQEESPVSDNLTVVNVQMEGMKSSKYSSRCMEYQQILTKAILQRHGYNTEGIEFSSPTEDLITAQPSLRQRGINAVIIGKKSCRYLPIDGHWHHHNRSSNEFKGIPLLITLGTPNPNVGSIEDEYLTLTGSLEGFQDYYRQKVQAEIRQLVGRQRAHLYPGQSFYIYMIGTNLDLSFLRAEGIKVMNCNSFEVTPEVGTQRQLEKWKLLQVVEQFIRTGQKVTQKELAELIGKSQTTISQLGWKSFYAKLLTLLRDPSTPANILQEHTKALQDKVLREWLELEPLDMISQSLDMIEKSGPKGFLVLLTCFDLVTQLKTLGTIAPLFFPMTEVQDCIETILRSLNTS